MRTELQIAFVDLLECQAALSARSAEVREQVFEAFHDFLEVSPGQTRHVRLQKLLRIHCSLAIEHEQINDQLLFLG